MSQHFVDTVIYKIITHIYAFFIVNLLFVISNALLIFVILESNLISTWLFLFIALLPSGPATAALFYSMGKLVREGDINPFKIYLKGYAMNFKIAVVYGFVISAILASLAVNLGFIFDTFWMAVLFAILITFVLITSLYGFAVLSRFEMNVKSICLFSIYLTFKYWTTTLYNFIISAFTLTILTLFTAYALPFVASVYVYWIMRNLKNILEKLERERDERNDNNDK